MRSPHSSIEVLESRIAPAAVFVSAKSATYTDADGDHVTVKFTKPVLTAANIGTVLITTSNGQTDHLDMIDLTGIAAAVGTGISVAAKVAGTGDGLVNVGKITSSGDLGAVIIHGDLDEIDAGDTTDFKAGVKSISLQSFGYASSLAGGATAQSTINGAVGSLKVATNMMSSFSVSDASGLKGDLKSLFVGGSLAGGSGDFSGFVSAPHKIGTITIHQSLIGGSGSYSGFVRAGDIGAVKIGDNIIGGAGTSASVQSNNAIASLTVGGSVIGVGALSAEITAGTAIGAIKIGRDLQGGAADSGEIIANAIKSVSVAASVIGGSGSASGRIFCSGDDGGKLGPVKIGGDLRATATSNSVTDTAEIWNLSGNVASVTIGHDAVASSSTEFFNGCVLAGQNLGPVKIGGSITGSGGADFVIRAKASAAKEVAIASLTVGGSVNSTLVLAGYGLSNSTSDGKASVGPVTVGGNWTASSISAGVFELDSTNGTPNFGLPGDSLIGGSPSAVSKIASIVIGGQIRGTPDVTSSADHFGFVAQQIGGVKVGGTTIPLLPGPHNDVREIGDTGDFTIREVHPMA